jgi:putative membrane protein
MENLAEKFLNDQDRERIKKAVEEAEKYTSGEIVPMVVSRSYHYPMSDVIGGIIFALPLSLIMTYFIGGWLWIGHYNMWLFLGIITALFVLFQQIIKRTDRLKRLFISDREIEEEVEEAAITGFFREGLYRTRDETGILIFISVFERRVWVLADRGINEKAKQGQWDEIVGMIIEGIKNNDQPSAICKAIEEVGRVLKEHFPVKADDRDELQNLIIEGD